MLDVQTAASDLCNAVRASYCRPGSIAALSEYRGPEHPGVEARPDRSDVPDPDPAERLAAALRRIALAVERREAAIERPLAEAAALPAVAGNLDALIGRLRAVLDEMSEAGHAGATRADGS